MNQTRFRTLIAHMPKLGLGLAALGRPGYINIGHGEDIGQEKSIEAMRANAYAVLDIAYASGVRYFDAARSYGEAEAFLGGWIRERGIDAADILVGSKWGYTYTAGWEVDLPAGAKHEVKSHSLQKLTAQYDESLATLGQYLSVYQIHSATLESGVMHHYDVLDRLAELRNNGLIIGFSVSGPRQAEVIERALDIFYDGQLLFGAVQVTFNLLERSTRAALEAAHAAGLTVIVKEGLANGRLAGRNHAPTFAKSAALLTHLGRKVGGTLDALSLAYCAQQPFVDLVLSGAARIDHFQSNLNGLELSQTAIDWSILDEIVEPAEQYWTTRSQLAWN